MGHLAGLGIDGHQSPVRVRQGATAVLVADHVRRAAHLAARSPTIVARSTPHIEVADLTVGIRDGALAGGHIDLDGVATRIGEGTDAVFHGALSRTAAGPLRTL